MSTPSAPATRLVLVGTYNGDSPEGIFAFAFNTSTGALEPTGRSARLRNPSFLAAHPDGRHLYAVSEAPASPAGETGAVAALAVEPADGALSLLGSRPSLGTGPCHLCVDEPGRHVLVANYGSGTLAAIPLAADGRFADADGQRVRHQGRGPNPDRQEGPHAHSVTLAPDGRFAFACDLGLDRIMAYRYDPERGRLDPADPPAAPVAPGTGPRHLAFGRDARHAYVVNEMASTVTAFAFDAAAGRLAEIQTLPTTPAAFRGDNTGSDIHVHPSGRYVYASNRGHDSIAVFAVDARSGRLSPVGHAPSGGAIPRSFAIDPSGTFLLAANQGSHTVVTFRIDAHTGMPAPTGLRGAVTKPVCVRFLPRA